MLDAGFSLAFIAEEIGLSRSMLSKTALGQRNLSESAHRRIAELLERYAFVIMAGS